MNFRTTCCTVLALMALAATARAQDAARQLHRIFEDHWTWRKKQFPDFAMSLGDYSNAQHITDNSLAAIEGRNRYRIELLRRLHAVGKTALDPAERLNYELFEVQLQNEITDHRYRMWLAPVGGRFGPQVHVPQMHERVRFGSYADYADYLTRLEQVPAALRNTTALLKLGMQEGRTPPRVALLGIGGQFEALLDGGLRALAEPLQDMPAAIDQQQQQQLRVRFESQSFPAVTGAMRDFGRFVVEQYIPACRREIAAASLPDGQAYYAHQLRVFTTIDLTAREIHELGLAEVARIRAEMIQVIRGSDFMQHQPRAALLGEQELFEAFVGYLRSDPRFYHRTEEELLRGYRDICKRIDAELPGLFGLLPRLPYGVRKIPDFMAPNQTTAYYSRGDIDNAQAGYFYANTYALDQRPRYEMVALALHEAVPGHHFQVALAQELGNLPQFRRHAWFTAFGEGWALYAERLGLEMGLFADPYDDFGRLLYEMWRACRLVVDPGMHALGWSRERAVRFMLQNTALSTLNINNEVDRYISWPGQATAYKIGELRIRLLRARAEQRLQERFDVRAFHDVVLGGGSLPLDILERRVDQWIAGQEHVVTGQER